MKKIEPILNSTFSDIMDMLQRIIIYYADPDSLGSFAKVSLDRRRKDSIQNGCSLFCCYRNNIPLECVEDVYDTTYENKDGSYTECEIIVWDDPDREQQHLMVNAVFLQDAILIFIPKCYLDPNNPDKYPYARNLQKVFYGEWIYLIENLYDHFYAYDSRYTGSGEKVYLMRRLFVSLGFIKSSYTVDIDDGEILYPYDAFHKGMVNYEYYQAVIWTIDNSAIGWNNNSVSENINKLLDGFDSYDTDYWADLIGTIEEAKAFEVNNDDDLDEIVIEYPEDTSCNE